MSDTCLTTRSALDLSQLIRRREVSPVDVLDAHLSVISRLNPSLNAIVTLAEDQARATAKDAENALLSSTAVGPLHGIPIVIKDVTQTAGIRTSFGSPLYRNFVPREDAEVVSRLRRAGAIILGKTNTPEFACGAVTTNELFGATCNPWDLSLTPAGSSGGSAVAVATGMTPLAQGTDFGGSLRVPAAFCGIIGLRTTAGLISNRGLPLPWDSGQVHGPLARTAEDAALMLDAMTGLDPLYPLSVAAPWSSALAKVRAIESAKGIRIAYVPDLAGIGLDPDVGQICRTAVDRLARSGAEVEEISFDLSYGRDAYKILRGEWMVCQQFERLDRIDSFGANLGENVRDGLRITTEAIAAAQHTREKILSQFRDLFGKVDFLITPTTPVQPFPVKTNFPTAIAGRKLDNYIDWVAPTFLVTLSGFPAASVPAGRSVQDLPVGIQIVGPRFSEPEILGLAKLIQEANPIGWPPCAGVPKSEPDFADNHLRAR
jgi:amidase